MCVNGIVFVLRSGIPWEMLPKELGCGSGMTCWRRLRDWQESGIWQLIRPDCVIGDRGYDAEAIRQGLLIRGIRPWVAKRNTEYGSGLGRWRWVIERTLPGSISFAACAFAMKSGLTSTRHSCRLDVP